MISLTVLRLQNSAVFFKYLRECRPLYFLILREVWLLSSRWMWTESLVSLFNPSKWCGRVCPNAIWTVMCPGLCPGWEGGPLIGISSGVSKRRTCRGRLACTSLVWQWVFSWVLISILALVLFYYPLPFLTESLIEFKIKTVQWSNVFKYSYCSKSNSKNFLIAVTLLKILPKIVIVS